MKQSQWRNRMFTAITRASKIVQWSETMLSKLAAFPCIYWGGIYYHLQTRNVFTGICLSSSPSQFPFSSSSDPPPPPPPWHQTWRPTPTATDIWWPSLETSSIMFTWGPPHQYWHLWWPPKHIQLASGWYASYWNAVLFPTVIPCAIHHTGFTRSIYSTSVYVYLHPVFFKTR